MSNNVIAVKFPNNFKRELSDELKSIASKLDSLVCNSEFDGENSSVVDFVESFFYGEAELRDVLGGIEGILDVKYCEIDEELFNRITEFSELMTKKEFFDFLELYSSTEYASDYHNRANEYFSQSVNYYTHTVSKTDLPEYFELTDEEQELVLGEIKHWEIIDEGRDYIDFEVEENYGRVYLELDVDGLFEYFDSPKYLRKKIELLRKSENSELKIYRLNLKLLRLEQRNVL